MKRAHPTRTLGVARVVALGWALLGASCHNPGRALTVYGGAYTEAALVDGILIYDGVEFEDSYMAAVALAQPFYVVLARERGDGGLAGLGLLIVAAGLAQSLSAPVWGRMADRSPERGVGSVQAGARGTHQAHDGTARVIFGDIRSAVTPLCPVANQYLGEVTGPGDEPPSREGVYGGHPEACLDVA